MIENSPNGLMMDQQTPSDIDGKLTVLSEHYNKCIDTLKLDIKYRDKYFLITLAILTLLLLKNSDKNLFEIIINKIINFNGNADIYKHNYTDLFLWGVSFFSYIKYTQYHSNIEVGYKYLKQLEYELNVYFGGVIFTKESSFYKDTKSYIKKTNNIMMKFVFPIIMLLIVVINIYDIIKGSVKINDILELSICFLFVHHVLFFMRES